MHEHRWAQKNYTQNIPPFISYSSTSILKPLTYHIKIISLLKYTMMEHKDHINKTKNINVPSQSEKTHSLGTISKI